MTSTEPVCERTGLYTLSEAAAILGVNKSTVTKASNRTDAGRLPYKVRKANGRRVWLGQDLINWWRLCY